MRFVVFNNKYDIVNKNKTIVDTTNVNVEQTIPSLAKQNDYTYIDVNIITSQIDLGFNFQDGTAFEFQDGVTFEFN